MPRRVVTASATILTEEIGLAWTQVDMAAMTIRIEDTKSGGPLVLERIAEMPQTRLHELLPWHWKPERQHDLAA